MRRNFMKVTVSLVLLSVFSFYSLFSQDLQSAIKLYKVNSLLHQVLYLKSYLHKRLTTEIFIIITELVFSGNISQIR